LFINANLAIKHAQALYQSNGSEIVRSAWKTVKVLPMNHDKGSTISSHPALVCILGFLADYVLSFLGSLGHVEKRAVLNKLLALVS
jgi:hypothetical protein